MEGIQKSIEALLASTGLDVNEAKTVVYWSTATNGLDELDLFPPLVLHGYPSTGKSTIMRVIQHITGGQSISTTSPARFRDLLIEHKVVLIEEADVVNEELILKRYARQTGEVTVNRPAGYGLYVPAPGNLYGATVLHKRHDFEDLAIQSRSIIIHTNRVEKEFCDMELDDSYRGKFTELWETAWLKFGEMPQQGRTGNNWKPLMIVALALEDNEWLDYVNNTLEKVREDLELDKEFELEDVLVNTIEYFKESNDNDFVYLSAIVRHLNDNYLCRPSPKRVAKIARQRGYRVDHHKEGHAVQLN